MSTFFDFNKTCMSTASLKDYYTFNTSTLVFFETDDCIYLNGIPCDKYTLAPITFYKEKPMANTRSIETLLAPYTNTRFFARIIGDNNKLPFKFPYAPNQTMIKNNARFPNGDEVIITPSSNVFNSATYDGSAIQGRTPVNYRNNAAIVYNKNTNKITNVLFDDLGLIKPSICNIDNDKFLTTKNLYYSPDTDCSAYGRYDSYINIFDKKTSSKSQMTVSDCGCIHNIIGRTSEGDLLLLNTISTGINTASVSSFSISKLSKSNLTISNIITTSMAPNIPAGLTTGITMEPAISLDCKDIYFPVLNTQVAADTGTSAIGGKSTYTINKYSVDIPGGKAVNVPIDINLNGLATSLNTIFNYSVDGYRHGVGECLMMNYLEVGGKKYLCATDVINSSNVYKYSSTIGTSLSNVAKNAMMYLFLITGDTLTLVDVRNLMGGATDPAQAVFPVNNGKNLLVIRRGGLDVLAIDTASNKFITQNTVGEPIFSCGVDELERIWYLTSSDSLLNDAKLKVFSVGAMVIIRTDFQDTNVNFTGISFNNVLNVSVTDNTNLKMATNVQLLLEGNAVFASTGTKSINVATNATDVVAVPVTITGDGTISVYSNMNIS